MLRGIAAFLCVAVLMRVTVSDPLYYYQSALAGSHHDDDEDDQSAALEEALNFSHHPETSEQEDAASVLKDLLNHVDQDSLVFKVVVDKDSGGFSLVFEPKDKANDARDANLGSFAELKEKLDEPRESDRTDYLRRRGQRAPKVNRPPTRSRNEKDGRDSRPRARSLPPPDKVEESSETSSANDTTGEPLSAVTESDYSLPSLEVEGHSQQYNARAGGETGTETSDVQPQPDRAGKRSKSRKKVVTVTRKVSDSADAILSYKQWPLLFFAFLTLLITHW